ncbi:MULTISPECIES: hypothetical protein [unclassified Cytobacillus]|uniref:hypothetical protein n=1 Tax=unclassified Cytobacillus TaxID=2675268 RepID=UPI00135B8235|nr:hypothetical protein [Cytobacillus sp. AMY 15.2]KAF0820698.1 hypothetical protein KIS4809_0225 [Bacillus sp. ZZV12-4809]MCM3090562.1 hypothetical protein [Cytobacillus sp. AMY 15.2]
MFIIFLLIWAAGIYLLFRSRNEEEEHLVLKLIGYYILGTFTFSFNGIILPVGFVISLFLKPGKNRGVKRISSVFGLVIMLLGLLL